MSKGWKRKLIAILFAIGFLSVGFAGGQYYLQQIYERQVELGYRRALGEFGIHLERITDELGRARLAVSANQRSMIASNLRRLVYAAQGNMGELPLGELHLERISYLLDRIYESSHDLVKGNIDTSALKDIHGQVEYVSHELGQLLVVKDREFPWVSWHEYISTMVLVPEFMQALTSINDGLEEFKTPLRHGEIQGPGIEKEQAIEAARIFSGRDDLRFQVTNETKGSIPSYTVEAKDDEARYVLEVSERGGMVLWMTVVSENQGKAERTLSSQDVVRKGQEFLQQRGFGPLHITDVQVLQNRATLTFVPSRDGVLRYAEPLRVQVNAVDGSIIGFWATPFFLAQSRVQGEMMEEPEVAWELEEKVQEGVEILDRKMALIQNERQEEVLTTRLGVKYEDDYYLIFLNLKTGDEERIERVSSPQFF
jgi:spore germination protein